MKSFERKLIVKTTQSSFFALTLVDRTVTKPVGRNIISCLRFMALCISSLILASCGSGGEGGGTAGSMGSVVTVGTTDPNQGGGAVVARTVYVTNENEGE